MGNVSKTSCKWVWTGIRAIQFDERFIKNYDEDSNKGLFLEVDVEYPKNLFNLQSDLPFLPERKKIVRCNKFVCDFYDKKKRL